MAVKGVFTSDAGIVGDRKTDFAGSLLQMAPTGTAPFFALTSGMRSGSINSTITTWFEENHISGRVNVTNNAGTGTSLIVSDASFIVPGHIFLIETTGEYVFVTDVTDATSTLTVIRGFAGTSAQAIDGSGTAVPVQKIGNAHEEGSSRPQGATNLGYPVFNYTQIFRTPWDVTRTARQSQYYTGNRVAKSRADGLLFHGEDIERSIIWGRRSHGVKNGKPFRTMNGIVPLITTNAQVQSTNVSYTDLRSFLQGIFEVNIKGQPNERIAFCGNSVVSVIDTLVMAHGHMNISPSQTEFGMNVRKWMTPFGDISLMTHPLMNESPYFTKDLYVLHPGAVEILYMQRTMEDSYDRDGTRAGVDADYGVWTTEMTMRYMAERTSGKYTGIDAADVSGL